MEPKQEKLLYAIKTAVSTYGMENVSTRNIATVAGVSDSNIYRFYKDRDVMLYEAFLLESEPLYRWIIYALDHMNESSGMVLSRAFCRKVFDFYWREMMEQPERSDFLIMYTRSKMYRDSSRSVQTERNRDMIEKLAPFFPDRESAELTVTGAIDMINGFAWNVRDGKMTDSPETRKGIFDILYRFILCGALSAS